MTPLTVTIRPNLEKELGKKNLRNFVESGYQHIHITPDKEVMRRFDKYGFIEKGFPYYGWLTAIQSAVVRTAINFDISLIFYGEDGEVEYGGSTETKDKALYDTDYMRRIYLEGGYKKVYNKLIRDYDDISEKGLYFWKFPSEEDLDESDLYLTHWSYFEPWDPYRNYQVAKEHCGLEEEDESNTGTFTNFAQNDQALYALHTYLMYLKFGFGRATQDAGIEIRRGAMTREQAKELVKMYDGKYPKSYEQKYLEYYNMNKNEFDQTLDKWANKDLFEKVDGRWKPTFEVK